MPVRKLASSQSCDTLSKFIERALLPPGEPVTSCLKCEEHGVQVIVTIAPYQPMRIHPGTIAMIDAMKGAAPPAKPTQQEKIIELLKEEVHASIKSRGFGLLVS